MDGGLWNPHQYSCLGNHMDRGAWWAIVHGVAKSQTWLSTHTHTHTHRRINWSTKFPKRSVLLTLQCQGGRRGGPGKEVEEMNSWLLRGGRAQADSTHVPGGLCSLNAWSSHGCCSPCGPVDVAPSLLPWMMPYGQWLSIMSLLLWIFSFHFLWVFSWEVRVKVHQAESEGG